MWKVGSCCDSLPELGLIFSLHATGMSGGEDSGGGGGGVHYDPTSGIARPTADGKWRLILGEGFASRVSGTVQPQDPGKGTTPITSPRLMKTDDISDTTELLRGGGRGVPSKISVVLVEETKAGGHFTTGVSR